MQFGPLIKYYRSKQGLTQKQLASGICSISHLSKIENNSKEANDDTIALLLERLHINIEKVTEKEVLIADLLSQLHEKMYFYQKAEVECIVTHLLQYEDIIPFTPHLYTYQLYKMRYYVFIGDSAQAARQKDLLSKQRKLFSQHESYLFHYYDAILYIIRGQFQKADEKFDQITDQYHFDAVNGEFLYFRSMVKSALEQSGHAIHFAKSSLQAYMNEHNMVRILHCLMLLGINYTHSGIYEEALSCFRHVERNAQLLREFTLLSQVYHNLGLLYKKMHMYPNALEYFKKSLSHQPTTSQDALVTQYVIAQVLFESGSRLTAKQAFSETLTLAEKLKSKKYTTLSTYYLLALEDETAALEYVTSIVIPYLETTTENKQDLQMFYELLSKHYQLAGLVEKALYYIRKTT